MGNCEGGGGASIEETKRSRQIDEVLKGDRKYADREIKILLLGAGESGKSTYECSVWYSKFAHVVVDHRIVKQMRILYDNGFTDEDRLIFKEIISANVILSMRALVLGLRESGVCFPPDLIPAVELFTSSAIASEQVE